MSEYLTDHTQTVKCPYPFNSLYYDMTNSMGPCSLNPLVPAVSVTEYLNSKPLLQIKTDMINEVRTTGHCNERCYKYEDIGFGSMRPGILKRFPDKSIYEKTKIQHIEVRFSNLCNCKCRICYSSVSSAIASEEKTHGIYNGPILKFAGPTEDFVLNEIKQYTDDLEAITFSGGEPMLHWQHWEFLDHLIANNKKIDLLYYSNGSNITFKGTHITEKWKHFNKILYRVSLDVSGSAVDYWRPGSGADWDTIVNNIRDIKNKSDNVDILYIITLAWPTLFRIGELLDEIKKINNGNFEFNFNAMWEPKFSIQNLPANIKKKAKEYLESIPLLSTTSKCKYIIDYMNSADKTLLLPAAFKSLKEVDLRRNQSFIDVFPEYQELAKEYGY